MGIFTGLAKRKRSLSCFQLKALVVVEVDVVVDHFIGLFKSLRFVFVDTFGFQNAKEIFSSLEDVAASAAPKGSGSDLD